VALPNLTNPYYVTMKRSFEDNGKKLGFKRQGTDSRQTMPRSSSRRSRASSSRRSMPSLLKLHPTPAPAWASVQELNKAKIPVFTINPAARPEGG